MTSFIPFAFVSSFLIHASDATPINPLSTNDNSNDLLRKGHSVQEINSLYSVGLSLLQFDLLCILYVFFRTFMRANMESRKERTLSMTHRLPFYMASSDLFIYASLTANLVIISFDDIQVIYLIVSASFYIASIGNMLLVCELSVLSWLRVCKKTYLHLGKFDYRIFIAPFFIPLIITIPAFKSFGSDEYWCFMLHDNIVFRGLLLSISFTVFTITTFCYISIIYEIKTVEINCGNHHFYRATRKISAYLSMYILQWHAEMYVFFACTAFIPIGGILNAAQYILNEGWFHNEIQSHGLSRWSQPTTPKSANALRMLGDDADDLKMDKLKSKVNNNNVVDIETVDLSELCNLESPQPENSKRISISFKN
ncbi:17334_t:CDS:2 [Funneliformis geosporum]|uniref:17334_t:CDS:1 n=1 Tax=Funneliformis geosporum TaxID=1117311 RepID=A0A9W4WK91_9GLOM|nr:17334_t:CDS:2 [Funneliformis geosporum]